jgi:hypothetical protein
MLRRLTLLPLRGPRALWTHASPPPPPPAGGPPLHGFHDMNMRSVALRLGLFAGFSAFSYSMLNALGVFRFIENLAVPREPTELPAVDAAPAAAPAVAPAVAAAPPAAPPAPPAPAPAPRPPPPLPSLAAALAEAPPAGAPRRTWLQWAGLAK